MSFNRSRLLNRFSMSVLAFCTLCGGATAQTGDVQACCQADFSCQMLDPAACDQIGGVSAGAGIECTVFPFAAPTCSVNSAFACCLPYPTFDNNDFCDNHPVYICVKQLGGVPNFDAFSCESLPDSDGDLAVDPCDGCPNDGQKTGPGQCGCFVPDTDSDGDSVADCVDQCPGHDDLAPGAVDDDDGDGVINCNDLCPGVDDAVYGPLCAAGLPTVSGWGMLVLAMLLLVTAKVCFHRRQTRAAAVTPSDPSC